MLLSRGSGSFLESWSPGRTFILRSAGVRPPPLCVRLEQTSADSLPVECGGGRAPHPGTCVPVENPATDGL
jgi:hypothetical protein